MDNKEKLNLDDITFDDFLDGGVDVTSEDTVPSDIAIEDKEIKAVAELDEDVKEKEEAIETEVEEEKEELVESKTDSAADDGVDAEESSEESEIDNTVIGEVLSNLGYELEGDYADTVEGLTQMTKDAASSMAEDQLDNLFEQFPEIQQHLEFVMNGGESEQFYSQGSRLSTVANVRLTEDNVSTQNMT